MKRTPLHDELGVRLDGVDLRSLSETGFRRIVDIYYQYSLVVFSGQQLAPADQAALTHRFGWPKIENRKQFNLFSNPEVSTIGNVRDESGEARAFFNRGGVSWHTDGAAACHVNAVTLLYAVEVPEKGGDTMFCSTAAGYDSLPEELRDAAEQLRMKVSFHAHNDAIQEKDPASHIALTAEERAALPPVWHDVVQTHPVTGRKVLYLYDNPLEFAGASHEQGQRVMSQLIAHCSRPGHVYQHRWHPGDLAIWDNHATMHSATDVHSYIDDRRMMHRSFAYTLPTAREIPNLAERNAIFSR